MRAALYARVSTDDQGDNFSLPSQLLACRQYAENHGIAVVQEITDEYSGMKLDRPGLDKLRKMARDREIDAVIVNSNDRWTRKLAHSLILREELIKFGVELHTVNRGKSEDTPEFRMTENIEGVFGEYWRDKLLEATRRGRREKARQGIWPGDSHPPFGYMRVGQGREATLAINPDEAKIVSRIYAMYTGSFGKPIGPGGIAAALTAERIPTPSRGKKGITWYRKTIHLILENKSYLGEFNFGGNPVNLPELAIIDQETWDQAQKRRKHARGVAGQYPRKHKYLLSGRVACSCGWAFGGNPSRNGAGTTFIYYECNRKKGGGDRETCKARIRQDVADQVVWGWLSGLLLDEEKLDAGLRVYLTRKETELSPKRERLEIVNGLIERQEEAINRLAAEFASQESKVVQAALKAQMRLAGRDMEALEGERTTLIAEIKQLEFTEADLIEIKAAAAKYRNGVKRASFATKTALINLYDVQAKLAYKDGVRGLAVTCSLTLDEEKWLALNVGELERSARGEFKQPNKIVVFSTWLPIPKRASLADQLFDPYINQPQQAIVNS